MQLTKDNFEDLEHYREMFSLLRDDAYAIIEAYKKNESEIEIGFNLGRLYALASTKHVAMLHTLEEIRDKNNQE